MGLLSVLTRTSLLSAQTLTFRLMRQMRMFRRTGLMLMCRLIGRTRIDRRTELIWIGRRNVRIRMSRRIGLTLGLRLYGSGRSRLRRRVLARQWAWRLTSFVVRLSLRIRLLVVRFRVWRVKISGSPLLGWFYRRLVLFWTRKVGERLWDIMLDLQVGLRFPRLTL